MKYIRIVLYLLVLNIIIVLLTWFIADDYDGYNHYDRITGEKNSVDEYEDASIHNALSLGWYLFSPFWMLYFVVGATTAFLYDAYRPVEKHNSYVWGYVADMCTVLMLLWSILIVSTISYVSIEVCWFSVLQMIFNNFNSLCDRFRKEI